MTQRSGTGPHPVVTCVVERKEETGRHKGKHESSAASVASRRLGTFIGSVWNPA